MWTMFVFVEAQGSVNVLYLPIVMTDPPSPTISDIDFRYYTDCPTANSGGQPEYAEPFTVAEDVVELYVEAATEYATGSIYRIEWWLDGARIETVAPTEGEIYSDYQWIRSGSIIYSSNPGVCTFEFPDATYEVRFYFDGELVESVTITTRN